jgi:broad specificity phosphatase PhoE
MGQELAGRAIDLCITSGFERTRETADLALEGRDVPRLVLEDLGDVRMGTFEGQPVEAFRTWQADHGPTDVIPGGGESRVEVIRRYCRAFHEVLARTEEEILVIAHGLPVTGALLAARGQDVPPTLKGIQVGYAQPATLDAGEFAAAVVRLESWADRTARGG